MQRRTFNRTLFFFGALAPLRRFAPKQETVIGHGDFRYRVDAAWCRANAQTHPVKDCRRSMGIASRIREINLDISVDRRFISGKPCEYWRVADFSINPSGEAAKL